MKKTIRQGDLFSKNSIGYAGRGLSENIDFSKKQLEEWQNKIYLYQKKFFEERIKHIKQKSLFNDEKICSLDNLNPVDLTPLPINFWRWQKPPHNGPAIYMVMERLERVNGYLLLYVGETITAEKRWKGEHDCKGYLSAYSEALASKGITSQLSIRFWTDVPSATKSRRGIEQELIQKWLPPFNKESRTYWATPFTTDAF